jgi:hypothetical protein
MIIMMIFSSCQLHIFTKFSFLYFEDYLTTKMNKGCVLAIYIKK